MLRGYPAISVTLKDLGEKFAFLAPFHLGALQK